MVVINSWSLWVVTQTFSEGLSDIDDVLPRLKGKKA